MTKITKCIWCQDEIERYGPKDPWVHTRSGDDGGTYDLCNDAPSTDSGWLGDHQPERTKR